MVVATGKTDWVRDVEDEKGSVMEAVRDCGVKPDNGVCDFSYFFVDTHLVSHLEMRKKGLQLPIIATHALRL